MMYAATARAGAYAARHLLARPLTLTSRPSSVQRQVPPLVMLPQARHRRHMEHYSRADGSARRTIAS